MKIERSVQIATDGMLKPRGILAEVRVRSSPIKIKGEVLSIALSEMVAPGQYGATDAELREVWHRLENRALDSIVEALVGKEA